MELPKTILATNKELYDIQQRLVYPQTDILKETGFLLEWSRDNEFRTFFLKKLIKGLLYEQLMLIPQLLVLRKSIKDRKDYSNVNIKEFIMNNYDLYFYGLCNFIIEDEQGYFSDYEYQILKNIKNNIKLPENTNFREIIHLGRFGLEIWQLIDGFGSVENMKYLPNELFEKLGFNTISKDQFLQNFPGKKPQVESRQSWVYEMNNHVRPSMDPYLIHRGEYRKLIIIDSSLINQSFYNFPRYIYPFIDTTPHYLDEHNVYKVISKCLDSLANSIPVDPNELFKEKPTDYAIFRIFRELQRLLDYMPRLYHSFSDFTIQIAPMISPKNQETLWHDKSPLYLVLLDKGLINNPKDVQDFNPILKDPQSFYEFGYSILNDNLEEFIEQVDENKQKRYKYIYRSSVYLAQVVASYGSDRIWNWLMLNGYKCYDDIAEYAFGGRNPKIIIGILNTTGKSVKWLLNWACQVYNYDVFSYLVEHNNVRFHEFAGWLVPSSRFIRKIKFPSIEINEEDIFEDLRNSIAGFLMNDLLQSNQDQ